MFSIKACIYIFRENEGGMGKDFYSGMRPNLMIKDWGLVCEVFHEDDIKIMCRGNQFIVKINIPTGEKFKKELIPNVSFLLNYGSKIIAKGFIVATQNKELNKSDE